jgi:hypothetical protein
MSGLLRMSLESYWPISSNSSATNPYEKTSSIKSPSRS